MRMIARITAVAMAALVGCGPALASGRSSNHETLIQHTEKAAAPLPGNAIKREDILLSRSLDDLQRYLATLSNGGRLIGDHDVPRKDGETLLKWAMRTHGLEWRDSKDAFTFARWRWPYILNPAGREAIVNIEVRAMAARSAERTFAKGAGADIEARRNLPPKEAYWMHRWLKLARKFESHFPGIKQPDRKEVVTSKNFADLDTYLTILSKGGKVGIRKLKWDEREPILAWGMRTYGLEWRTKTDGSHKARVEARIEKVFEKDVFHAWMYRDTAALKKGIAEIRRLMATAG